MASKCKICGAEDATFKCNQCKRVFYCSVQHQLEDLREHKYFCQVLPPEPAKGSGKGAGPGGRAQATAEQISAGTFNIVFGRFITLMIPIIAFSTYRYFHMEGRYALADRLLAAKSENCTAEDRQFLETEFGDFDIVIPWVNGSDAAWLQRRRAACTEWLSLCRARCQNETKNETTENATNSSQCSTPCSRQVPCGDSHTNIHKDHDELRYLLRSLDRHLPWHRGRILLITPQGQVPTWLRPTSELKRLKVVHQEELFEALLASKLFVPASQRSEDSLGSFLPGNIFNDFPIEHALAFLPNSTDNVMLIQDDLLIGRPMSICELFTKPPTVGLRLFSKPYNIFEMRDPSIIDRINMNSLRLFWNWQELEPSIGTDQWVWHQHPLHAPQMLNIELLRKIWQMFPREMSASTDSPFRNVHGLDMVGLHHAFAVSRSGRPEDAEPGTATGDPTWLSKVVDLMASEEMQPSVRPAKQLFFEAAFKNGAANEWHKHMLFMSPEPEELPLIMGFQDLLVKGQSSELDCLRERWLTALFSKPSSWELPKVRPGQCRAYANVDLSASYYASFIVSFNHYFVD